jgi:PAP_fibrillin
MNQLSLLLLAFTVVVLVLQHNDSTTTVTAFTLPLKQFTNRQKQHTNNNIGSVLNRNDPLVTTTTASSTLTTKRSLITTSIALQMGFFQDFFATKSKAQDTSSTMKTRRILNKYQQEQILELKRSIVLLCDEQPVNRKELESVIDELSTLSIVIQPANSIELCKQWIVLYTTEKEINFFLDNRLATTVDQTISNDRVSISNRIPFNFGGGLYVDGTLSPADATNDDTTYKEGIRTNFQFTSATLDIGGFFQLKIPPIGKGWFDTIYLDDDFRIDYNSRNDILICIPAPIE